MQQMKKEKQKTIKKAQKNFFDERKNETKREQLQQQLES